MRDLERERRQAGRDLAEIVRLAEEYRLPLPIEPTRTIGGVIVHPDQGPGIPRWPLARE
jgi:hypothetical protein